MGTPEPVDIVIPVYNAVHRLIKCVAALEKNTLYPYRLLLIDDCSSDKRLNSVLNGLADGPRTTVVRCEENLGFANVNNLAVEEYTTSEFFCLLNEDTEPFRGWLTALVEAMSISSEVGIVGAKLIFPPDKPLPLRGKIQHIGVARGADGAPFHPHRGQAVTIPAAQRCREVNAVTGACMLIRRAAWQQIGGFDPDFTRGQFEDVHFCWLARKAGWRIRMETHAVAYHYEHGSGEQHAFEHHDHNRALLLSRWRGAPSDVWIFKELK